MKYKVGDKVRVRSWDSMAEQFGVDRFGDIKVNNTYFVDAMRKCCGETLTITSVNMSSYQTKGNSWQWTDEMFEPGVVCNTVVIYTNGNKVIAVDKATGETGVAICSPEDEFDFFTGADLAFERLRGRAEPAKERGPKYYSGEIVCVKTKADNLTVGKIYKVKNGKFTDDWGRTHGEPYPYTSFEDLNAQHCSEFIEVVR
jgi:hypothetical protein